MTSQNYASFLDKMTSRQNIAIISYVPSWEKDYDSTLSRLNKFMQSNGKVITLNSAALPLDHAISVNFDEQRGGELAANFMLDHPELKSILRVIFTEKRYEDRSKAFSRVLAAQGIEPRSFVFHHRASSTEVRNFIGLINELPKPVGIFFTCRINELVDMLKDEGVKLGPDMLCVCYGYSELDPYVERMYTINEPFYDLGVTAIQTLAKMLNNVPVKPTKLMPTIEKINWYKGE
jgi:DNA-binding LacI/PurR family transcriptional regulator